MNEIDAGAGGSPRQPDQRPACIAWRMRRIGDVLDTGWDGARVATERDHFERLAERDQRTHQLRRITADSRGRRAEGVAVETDAKSLITRVQNAARLLNAHMQSADRAFKR